MKKKEHIEPQYLYDEHKNPIEVYLNIQDYQDFMHKLEILSQKIKKKQDKLKEKKG